ncbi:MAG: isochorismatase family protein [Nakamurella sp.]
MTTNYAPSSALVVVDMQHDFADPAGTLYVPGGEELTASIALEIATAQEAGATVIYTQDWHPAHTPHFQADGGLWPAHCVANSDGAALVPDLPIVGPLLRKGTGSEDGYSGFSEVDLATGATKGTDLSTILDDAGVMAVTVVGLAGDWCVKATAIDGVALGYTVTVPLSLTRFVELEPGDTERAVVAMRAAGVSIVD